MKQVKGRLVPKLRFKEFEKDGEWKKQPLGKFLDYQQPTPYLVSDTKYSDDYKIPVLTAGKTFVLGYTNEQHGIFKDNLPVIIFDDFTTATQFVDFPFKAKSSAMKILLPKNGVSIKFMHEAMKMISYEVGSHERHWISKFAPMLIAIPTDHREQQKIADCLSSLDELIDAEDKKLEALQRHKKGLMQELFPAEGQTLPKLRFPEFKNSPEWDENNIESVCQEIFSGGTPSTTSKNYYNGNVPFIRSAEINKESTELFLSKEGLTNSAAKLIKKGDVLVALYGANSGDVAIAKLDGAINQAILCLKSNNLNGFMYQYLSHKKNWLVSTYTQGGQGNLSGEIVKSIIIKIPKEPIEQQRIADFLSSIDNLITAQNKKLESLRLHKKGLMQQLFPNPDN